MAKLTEAETDFYHRLIQDQTRKMISLKVLRESSFFVNIDDKTIKVLNKKSKTKFADLLADTEAYLQAMENIQDLNILISNPATYIDIQADQREEFKNHLQRVLHDATRLLREICKAKDITSKKTLADLHISNQTVTAVKAYIKDPFSYAKLMHLEYVGKDLKKVKFSQARNNLVTAIRFLGAFAVFFIGLKLLTTGVLTYGVGIGIAINFVGAVLIGKSLSLFKSSGEQALKGPNDKQNAAAYLERNLHFFKAKPVKKAERELFAPRPISRSQSVSD
jgi:hypothetical protein